MNNPVGRIGKEVSAYCAEIGGDSLLVQGAGGNASWKENDTLWVKASGTWLADAGDRMIFVPVNLQHLRQAFARGDYSVAPQLLAPSGLRPSIETSLHALMPQRVVFHLHAVEILAHMVRSDAAGELGRHAGDLCRWVFVDYFKPGPDLTRAVSRALEEVPDAEVVFLKNHGVVIGGDDCRQVDAILEKLLSSFATTPMETISRPDSSPDLADFGNYGYRLAEDPDISRLVLDDVLCRRLRHEWALYPDHVVFLGASAVVMDVADSPRLAEMREFPPFLFVRGAGVLAHASVTRAQAVQLRCYFDVLVRQDKTRTLSALSSAEVAALLDWDSEKYRKGLSAST